MTFAEVLTEYMNKIPASAKEISELSGLSMATISRFKNGKREPSSDSDAVEKLADALATLSSDKKYAKEEIHDALMAAVDKESIDFEQIAANFNSLINTTGMNVSNLSRYLSFDPSYLSRIRSGARKPGNINKFLNDVAEFTAAQYGIKSKTALSQLIGCKEEEINTEEDCAKAVLDWLANGSDMTENIMDQFFEKLDSFDLNEYTRMIHFDDIKVPTAYFQIPVSKDYYNSEGYMKAELAWLKATALSPSKEPVLMYSDMPFEELTKDPEYPKKWMYGLAVLIKKGLKLNMIHSINRSFYEMIYGLVGWIPLYMTGQVSPYYFKGMDDPVFQHFIRVSGEACVEGHGVSGVSENTKFHFTKNKDEMAYYKKTGRQLLSKAHPLMDIYRQDMAAEYSSAFRKNLEYDTKRIHSILPSPPIYTLSESLMERILDRNRVHPDDKAKIIEFAKKCKGYFLQTVEKCEMFDEIHFPTKEEFEKYSAVLLLSDMFYEKDIFYTYEEYLEHIKDTEEYVKKYENYNIKKLVEYAFRHIQIRISEGRWTLISKDKSPAIHFVIKHPQLRQAIERMGGRSLIAETSENTA